MKQCTKCKEERSLDQFTRRKKGGRYNSWCRTCTVEATREGRRNNKEIRERNLRGNARRRQLLIDEVNELKREPCGDCSRRFKPWQMHFDHVRGKKVGDVSTLVRRGNKETLFEEIKKCELVCACCHADRTHKRNHGLVV